ERLVENQELGIVGQRLSKFDALTHALTVGADLLVRGIREIDEVERTSGRLAGLRFLEAVETGERGGPFHPGPCLVQRVLAGAETDAEVQRRISPDWFTQNGDGAFAGRQLPGNDLHEGGLASAVRAKQSGDARRQLQCDVV